MKELQDAIRSTLHSKLDRVVGDDDLLSRVRRRARVQRALILSSACAGSMLVIVGLLAGPSLYLDRNQDSSTGQVRVSTSTDPERRAGNTPITPVVTLASGRQADQPWMLTGYVAEIQTNLGTDGGRALCLDWEFGDEAGPGLSCFAGMESGLPPDETMRVVGIPGPTSLKGFFGLISANVASLEVQSATGSVIGSMDLTTAPKDLGLNEKVFAGFVDEERAEFFVARGADGSVIDRRPTDTK